MRVRRSSATADGPQVRGKVQRKVVVDIDNTLWDFAPVLYQGVLRVNPAVTPPELWTAWDFWRPFVPAKVLYEIIRKIHSEQDRFPVFPDARAFLDGLRESGLKIVIASHREKGTLGPTVRWLERHGLPHDEVHLSHDKTVLFPESWAIVDDSPVTLREARRAGIVRAGLRSPWNREEEAPLFDSLPGVLSYLRERL